jgi:hypothetical protein
MIVLSGSLLMFSAMASAAPLSAQTTSAAMLPDDLLLRVRILADDSMLGRNAGGIGNVRATDYVADELARLGLEPAGHNGFFQTIPLVTRGPVRGAHIEAGGVRLDSTDIRSPRATGGAPLGGLFNREDVPTIYGGVVGARTVDPALVEGKVVIFRIEVGPNGRAVQAFAGTDSLLAPYAGAAGMLFVGMERLSPQFLNGLRVSRYALADSAMDRQAGRRRVPAALITTQAANRLFGPSFAESLSGVAGRPISGRWGLEDTPMPYPARNVIGIVRGTDPARRGEFVAIGAHTDHVGVGIAVDHDSVRVTNAALRPLGANGRPRRPQTSELQRIAVLRDSLRALHGTRMDSIFNGADDDASGTAVALEMAEYFVQHPTRRSLLFVLHTAEEKGLFGAEYYTDHPTVALDSIIAELNMDQVSRGGPSDVAGSAPNTVYLLGTRRRSSGLGDLVERINARPAHNLRLDYSLDAPGHPSNGYCRSDHYMYARFGIPIVFLTAGWHRDYHMVTDEAAYVDAGTMLRIGTFARDIVAAVADADDRPVADQPKPDPGAVCRQ